MFGIKIEKLNSGYFTDICEILGVIPHNANNCNLLISDYECNVYPFDAIKEGKKYIWLTTDELMNALKGEDIQFIWCVASVFKKDVKLEEVRRHPLPIANGNDSLWTAGFGVQHPLADFEIVSWDATTVFVISKTKDIIDTLSLKYPVSSLLK